MRQRGFVLKIVVIIIALALLYYFFDWSIFEFLESEKGKKTVEYIKEIISVIWSYIDGPVMFVWDKIKELLPSS